MSSLGYSFEAHEAVKSPAVGLWGWTQSAVCLQEERRGAFWPAAREEMLGQNFTGETNLTIPEPLTPFPSHQHSQNHSGKELSQLVQHITAVHTHTHTYLKLHLTLPHAAWCSDVILKAVFVCQADGTSAPGQGLCTLSSKQWIIGGPTPSPLSLIRVMRRGTMTVLFSFSFVGCMLQFSRMQSKEQNCTQVHETLIHSCRCAEDY